MPPVVPPFLVGLIAAPLVKKLAKPLILGVIRTSVGVAVGVKRVAQQAGEGLRDLTAEATAEMFAADLRETTESAEEDKTHHVQGPKGQLTPVAGRESR